MSAARIATLLRQGNPGQSVTIQGWVRTKRELKEFSFIEVNDGSALASLQVLVPATLPNAQATLKALSTGAAVTVQGTLAESPGKKQRLELHAESLHLWAEVDAEAYPLQKKRHSFEFLRTIAHLRSRTNTLGAVFRVRNACAAAIHQFFQQRGFLWVHTPILTANDCEGAGELFTVTHLDLSNLPRTPEGIDFSQDFFGRRAYLSVSGQLEAEIMALAFGQVYTFGPTFRAENSHTSRHLAEFWMVEPEMAFCDLQGDMELAEAFLQGVMQTVLDQCPEDLQFFQERIDATVLATAESILAQPFARLSYTEAIKILEASDRPFTYPVAWGLDLQSEHERYLAEDYCQRPVIIYDYPASLKPFYMRVNEDSQTVAAMDILAPKIGEIIGGSQREERLEILQQRLVNQGLSPDDYWWYLDLRRFGTVPHAGFGLGFERLLQLITGMANIRDVIPFPRTPQSLDF